MHSVFLPHYLKNRRTFVGGKNTSDKNPCYIVFTTLTQTFLIPKENSNWYYHKCDPYRSALGPPSPLYHGYRVSFPRVKRPRRRVDRLPPSSAKVKERVQLYFYSPSGPSRPVLGPIYPYLLLYNISNITQYM
jgi:hypothetical protein